MSELTNIIRTEIAARGSVSFAQFMGMVLYQPGLGYYETDRGQVGFQGDFYTSVSVGELFGQLLAFRFAAWLGELPAGAEGACLVESGAHDGKLAGDILTWLGCHRPALSAAVQYWIVEPSPRRRAWQMEKLKDFGPRVRWAERLSDVGHGTAVGHANGKLSGIIFSNELLDAMPVHRLGWDAARQRWFEWGVAAEGDQFVWTKMPLTAAAGELLVNYPEELLAVLPDGYTIEVCPAAAEWWREAAAVLEHGRLMTIDYGFTSEEMISPSRTKGTLRAYYRHQLSDDLLIHPGEQDLTAHVNFSAIQAAGERAGLGTEGYLTQPQFLTKILAEAVLDEAFRPWNPARTRQFQTLTHPAHLGRAFKVLIQRRNCWRRVPILESKIVTAS